MTLHEINKLLIHIDDKVHRVTRGKVGGGEKSVILYCFFLFRFTCNLIGH